MDGVEHNRTPSSWWARLPAALVAALVAGCGGGGGGDAAAPQVAVSKVVVLDDFGAPVSGATVSLASASAAHPLTTDSNGVALLASVPGPIEVAIAVPTFAATTAQVNASTDQVTTVAVTLKRLTAPAGGSMASRSGVQALRSADGRTLTFEVELVVMDADATPLEGLVAGDFQLLNCVPDAATPAADCLRSAMADHAYQPTADTTTLVVVPGQAVAPYAAGLLIDQSGSISRTDPLNARLYAAKSLLKGLSAGDQVLIGAFADGAGAAVPQQPLTLLGGFVDAASVATYFSGLDGLARQVGGQTPLFTSIDAMRTRIVTDTAVTAGHPRALVVFTDGADTTCGNAVACALRRQQVIDAAVADGVRLFTIGLSGGIDVETLSKLAAEGGGAMLYADSVEQLIPLYGSLGRLMSLSLPTYRLRFTVDAGEAGVFAPGQTVLARARVNARGRSVDIPFAVAVR